MDEISKNEVRTRELQKLRIHFLLLYTTFHFSSSNILSLYNCFTGLENDKTKTEASNQQKLRALIGRLP